jgi:hypothetical protein
LVHTIGFISTGVILQARINKLGGTAWKPTKP